MVSKVWFRLGFQANIKVLNEGFMPGLEFERSVSGFKERLGFQSRVCTF